jgi:hypothetical protein
MGQPFWIPLYSHIRQGGAVCISHLEPALFHLVYHRLTMAYHQQANGMVERFHQQLKDALRARLINHDWHSQLLWVLLGYELHRRRTVGYPLRRWSMESLSCTLITSLPSPDLLEQLMQSMARFVPPVVRLTSRRPPSCTSRGEEHPQPSLPSTRDPTRC